MTYQRAQWLILGLFALALGAACGGDDRRGGRKGGEIAFETEIDLFPGFDYATGLQPAGSPVQASFSVMASGMNKVSAKATGSGSELKGTAGSGTVVIEGAFALDGRLVVDISGVPSYDGPIPGIENTEITFSGSALFDPFAIDAAVPARADIPPTQLPGIPLPGGIPGQLVLEVAQGSFVEVTFTGRCAAMEGSVASFSGTTARGGLLVIKPVIEIKVPVVGTKTFEMPEVSVDLALGTSAVVMTTDGSGVEVGSCSDGGLGGAGAGTGAGGPGTGGSGAGTTTGAGGTTMNCTTTDDCPAEHDCVMNQCVAPGPAATATVKVNGVAMTVTEIVHWPQNGVDGDAHVFIKFVGPDFGSGSDIVITLSAVGAGCDMGNRLFLRAELGNPVYPNQYSTLAGSPTCGLSATSLASGPGEWSTGGFSGTLHELNGSKTVTAAVTFEVPH